MRLARDAIFLLGALRTPFFNIIAGMEFPRWGRTHGIARVVFWVRADIPRLSLNIKNKNFSSGGGWKNQ